LNAIRRKAKREAEIKKKKKKQQLLLGHSKTGRRLVLAGTMRPYLSPEWCNIFE
jgi:hypothetical protein